MRAALIYAIININKEAANSDGVNAALKLIGYFKEEEQEFYDFNFTIDKTEKADGEIFPISGYKNAESANIVWSKY